MCFGQLKWMVWFDSFFLSEPKSDSNSLQLGLKLHTEVTLNPPHWYIEILLIVFRTPTISAPVEILGAHEKFLLRHHKLWWNSPLAPQKVNFRSHTLQRFTFDTATSMKNSIFDKKNVTSDILDTSLKSDCWEESQNSSKYE